MSHPDVFAALVILALFGGAGVIASAIEKSNRHLSNIADRLLDIQNELSNRRP